MGEIKAKIDAQIQADKIKPKELDIPPGELSAILELTLTDEDGNVTGHWEQKSESFVKQFLQLLYVQGYGLDWVRVIAMGIAVKDTGGTDRLPVCDSEMFDSNAGAGTTNNGVVVGTGSTAPTISDYQLETPIAHGTGAGQLQYGAVTFGAPSAGPAISQFRITRPFSNGSGGAVSVAEIGLYVYDGSYHYMTIRDVLGSPVSIPNGQTLTINYQIQGSV